MKDIIKLIIALIAAYLLFSCSKEIDAGYCCSVIIYENGIEIKRTTAAWKNAPMPNDTIYCYGQMIVTIFHKCKN